MSHSYDDDYEPAFMPWLTTVSLAETRAPTKEIDPRVLSILIEFCKKAEY